MIIVCPCCGKKIISQASAVCNWCGYRIDAPGYQEHAAKERDQFWQHCDEHDQHSIAKLQELNRYSREKRLDCRYGVWLGDTRSLAGILLTIAVLCFCFGVFRGIPVIDAIRTSGINGYVRIDGGRQVTQSPVKTELSIACLCFLGGVIFTTLAWNMRE